MMQVDTATGMQRMPIVVPFSSRLRILPGRADGQRVAELDDRGYL